MAKKWNAEDAENDGKREKVVPYPADLSDCGSM